eukprot:766404-Hanusia_phi.AAC.3
MGGGVRNCRGRVQSEQFGDRGVGTLVLEGGSRSTKLTMKGGWRWVERLSGGGRVLNGGKEWDERKF